MGALDRRWCQLTDEEEADKAAEWWKDKINHVWERREGIVPCDEGRVKPKLMDVLRLLPKKRCGSPCRTGKL